MALVNDLIVLLEMQFATCLPVPNSNPNFGHIHSVTFCTFTTSPHMAHMIPHCTPYALAPCLIWACYAPLVASYTSLLCMHQNKLHANTCTGIFLGYSQILKNILYYDLDSHQVKSALCVVFDEAMMDLDTKTTNAQFLQGDSILPTDVLIATEISHCLMSLTCHSQPLPPLTCPVTLILNFLSVLKLPLVTIFIMPISFL